MKSVTRNTPYTEDEWEDDLHWLAKRLGYIWWCLYNDVPTYNKLLSEKEMLYSCDNSVCSLAHKEYSNYDFYSEV